MGREDGGRRDREEEEGGEDEEEGVRSVRMTSWGDMARMVETVQ